MNNNNQTKTTEIPRTVILAAQSLAYEARDRVENLTTYRSKLAEVVLEAQIKLDNHDLDTERQKEELSFLADFLHKYDLREGDGLDENSENWYSILGVEPPKNEKVKNNANSYNYNFPTEKQVIDYIVESTKKYWHGAWFHLEDISKHFKITQEQLYSVSPSGHSGLIGSAVSYGYLVLNPACKYVRINSNILYPF